MTPSLPRGAAAPSRRALLAGAGSLGAAALLAACGTDTSDRYATGGSDDDSGYVSGDGIAVEIDAADRGDAVDFSGTDYDGQAFASADVLGEVLVLNVWYASCPPCRQEAPDLQAIHEEFAEDGVVMVGVNVRDEAGPAQAFEEKYGLTYPSLPDLDATIMYALRGQVSPNAVPSTLVIDHEGRVAARISGAADPSTLRAMIQKVLAE
ncbi:TlpA family protein disulfide reductase [Brachybacterium sp. DNPG3]